MTQALIVYVFAVIVALWHETSINALEKRVAKLETNSLFREREK